MKSLMRILGFITGALVGPLTAIWKAVKSYVQVLVVVAVIVLALPSIAEYWLRHARIPDVPVSAIVLLLVASFFLIAFAAAIYAVTHCLMQIQVTERTAVTQARRRRQVEETGGSFVAGTDDQAWQQEQLRDLKAQGYQTDSIDLLRRNGILTEDDENAIKEMAESAMLRNRGRTG